MIISFLFYNAQAAFMHLIISFLFISLGVINIIYLGVINLIIYIGVINLMISFGAVKPYFECQTCRKYPTGPLACHVELNSFYL